VRLIFCAAHQPVRELSQLSDALSCVWLYRTLRPLSNHTPPLGTLTQHQSRFPVKAPLSGTPILISGQVWLRYTLCLSYSFGQIFQAHVRADQLQVAHLFGAIQRPVTWNLPLRTQCTSTPTPFNNEGSINRPSPGIWCCLPPGTPRRSTLPRHTPSPFRSGRLTSPYPYITNSCQLQQQQLRLDIWAPSADGTRWQIHINREDTQC
jgi:hypothetical protein